MFEELLSIVDRYPHWYVWVAIISLVLMSIFRGIIENVVQPHLATNQRRKTMSKNRRITNSKQKKLKNLREMNDRDFGDYITSLFSAFGYRTKTIGGYDNGGLSITMEKNGLEHYIKCKRFKNKVVDTNHINNFYNELQEKKISGKTFFITTNSFSFPAERFAKEKNIELIDGLKLIEYVDSVDEQVEEVVEEVKEQENIVRKRCPLCTGFLIKKTNELGEYLGCTNYPACNYTQELVA